MSIGSSGRRAVAVCLSVAVVLAAAAALVAPPRSTPAVSAATARVAQRPNVLLLLTDDMRTSDLRYLPKTLRALGGAGVTFEGAMSPNPLCCPARASLVTGQASQNNGVQYNRGPWGGFGALQDKANTLPVWLQRVGYRTTYLGKYLNGWGPTDGRQAGWNNWWASTANVYDYRQVSVAGKGVIHDYTTHVQTKLAIRSFDQAQRAGRPFFTFVNYLAPHNSKRGLPVSERTYAGTCDRMTSDAVRKPSYLRRDASWPPAEGPVHTSEAYTRSFRARICSLKSVDDTVAAFVRALRLRDELRNTYIVFSSDNGFQLGEHRESGKSHVLDESLRVPLLVRGPGYARGARTDVPVTLTDLTATILGWTGARAGRRQDGVRLEALMRDPELRDTLLVQTGSSTADETPGWRSRGVSTSRYLYTDVGDGHTIGLLLDRQRDPYGLVNRWAEPGYALVREALQRRLEQLEGCAGATCNRRFGPPPEPLA